MSRSFGGTSLTTSPSTAISPALISSSPAIIRSVVVLPQPEGPTSTTNSLSAMSRSMPRTASVSSKRLTSLRSETCAMARASLALGGAGGEPGDVVVHEEGVDDERRGGAEKRPGHDLTPVEHVALDQRRDDADRQHELVGRGGEGEGIKKLRPRNGEGENGRGDEARQRDGYEHARENLPIVRAVHQRCLVELLGDRGEVSDHDPGAERHRQRRIKQPQHPPAIDRLDAGVFVDQREHLEQRDEQQRFRDQIGEKDSGRERGRAPEPHARERERRGHADQHGDRHDDDRDQRGVAKEGQVLRRGQELEVIAERRMVDPPRIGRGRNLRAGLERRDQHVDRRHQEEDREYGKEEIRPAQRPPPVPAHTAVSALPRGRVGGGDGCRGHDISLARRWMSRRMNTAATVRIGTMNSETLAPSGMSLPWMPIQNAQVAKTWVRSIGPPAVRMRTMSKLAKVTIRENSAVMAMMLRIMGSVTYHMRCHQLAPSIAAAS